MTHPHSQENDKGLYATMKRWRIDPWLYGDIRYLHLRFQQHYLLCRQLRHIHNRCFIHSICQHLPGNLKASLVHAFSSAFLYTFLHTFLHTFLVSVIQEGPFNTYRIPKLVVSTELGIREAGNLQFFYRR